MTLTPGFVIGTFVAVGLTLIMFSFIYKDNPFFKFGEHLYLGISIGYFINVQYWQYIYPELGRRLFIDHNYWVIVPALLGIFILLRLVPSLAWLSRMSFALYVGGTAGLAVPYVIHGQLLPQLDKTIVPFHTGAGSLGPNITQALILIGVFSVLTFFFFSVEHKKAFGAISKVGILFLMVGFGAAFGSTVMARVSLLVGRFQFLIVDFPDMLRQLRGGG